MIPARLILKFLCKSVKQESYDISARLYFLQEIEVEYGRIFAVQNTLYHYGEELVKNGFSSNEEALRLYVACEDYERAFDFATKCNLGYEDIFISLTDMCLRYHAEDPPDLPGCMVTPPNYLSAGDADVIQHQMVSPSEKLWMLLKKRLDELNDLVGNYRYHVVVAEHVLKSQKINDLPFWIRNTLKVFVHKVIIYLDPMLKFPLFKNNCMDKLLKLYLDHSDALSAASILVKEMEKVRLPLMIEGSVLGSLSL